MYMDPWLILYYIIKHNTEDLTNERIAIMKQKIRSLMSVQLHSQLYFSTTQVRLLPVYFQILICYKCYKLYIYIFQYYQWITSSIILPHKEVNLSVLNYQWIGRQPTIVTIVRASAHHCYRAGQSQASWSVWQVYTYQWSYQWHERINSDSTVR